MPASYSYILLLATLCFAQGGNAQCPFAVTLYSTGNCQGDALTLTTDSSLTQIVWFKDGVVDTVVTANPNYKPAQAGTYSAAVSVQSGCTVTTNAILLMPSPHITAGPSPTILPGESLTLQPIIVGDVSSYSWSPATGLSDPHIANPVATPLKSTIYTLQVFSAEGCQASAQIKVTVFSPVRIPNAFTPNGDGKNDIFYVLGGSEVSRIKDFSVFNRWGQKVFQRTDLLPGDPRFGWNGNYKGSAAPPGTYIYIVSILFQDGTSQLLRGIVILVR
jgi:gliding motility-associated-like protein